MTPDLEAQIAAKASSAPRVTAADIQNAISSVHFFTAWEGAQLAYWSQSNPDNPRPIKGQPDKNGPLSLLTFCVIVLKNGFTVTGEAACASPENYNKTIGETIARHNAEQKMWPLLGYALRDQLSKLDYLQTATPIGE